MIAPVAEPTIPQDAVSKARGRSQLATGYGRQPVNQWRREKQIAGLGRKVPSPTAPIPEPDAGNASIGCPRNANGVLPRSTTPSKRVLRERSRFGQTVAIQAVEVAYAPGRWFIKPRPVRRRSCWRRRAGHRQGGARRPCRPYGGISIARTGLKALCKVCARTSPRRGYCVATIVADGAAVRALKITTIICSLAAASCTPDSEVTGTTNACPARLRSSYNAKDMSQCVDACMSCDRSTRVTCSTSCTLKGAK